METQKSVTKKGWSMRLGSYDCVLRRGSKVENIYRTQSCQLWDDSCQIYRPTTDNWELITITERHRHRYEFHNRYREEFEKAGFLISGTSPDGNLVEMVELKDHLFMIATQAHPELKSRPTNPHPLFLGFIVHCISLKGLDQ
jgi:CTP synthase